MASFRINVTGIRETISRIQNWDKKMRRAGLLKIGRAGAKPVKAAMIRNAPQDKNAKPPNTWRKSVGSKVKIYRSGTVMFFVVGPRAGYTANVVLKTKFFRGKDGRIHPIPIDRSKRPEMFNQMRRPSKYSHLVEAHGHVIAQTKGQTRAAAVGAMQEKMAELVAEV